jgi:NAD+ kinase
MPDNQTLTEFPDGYKHKNYDLILAIGGDGTFLYSARTFADFEVPMLGINTGRLGFLMELPVVAFPRAMDELANGNGRLRERALLEVEVRREGKPSCRFRAANDLSFPRGFVRDGRRSIIGLPTDSGSASYLCFTGRTASSSRRP